MEEPSRTCANSATARPRSLGRRGRNLLVAERHQSAGHRGMGCASATRRLPLASGPPSGAWFADNKAPGGLHPLPGTCRGPVSRRRGNRTGPSKDVAYRAEEIDHCIVPGWYSTPEHGYEDQEQNYDKYSPAQRGPRPPVKISRRLACELSEPSDTYDARQNDNRQERHLWRIPAFHPHPVFGAAAPDGLCCCEVTAPRPDLSRHGRKVSRKMDAGLRKPSAVLNLAGPGEPVSRFRC